MSLYLQAALYRQRHDWAHGDDLLALHAEMRELEKLADVFKTEVWDGELEKYIQKSNHSGHSMKVGPNVALLILCSAARVMFTIQEEESWNSVTLIAAEKNTPNVGVQGIACKVSVAKKLIRSTMRAWKRGVRPTHDICVGFG